MNKIYEAVLNRLLKKKAAEAESYADWRAKAVKQQADLLDTPRR